MSAQNVCMNVLSSSWGCSIPNMWGRKVERNPGKKEMATPQESSWKGTSYMDEKLLDNTGYLVCAGTEDALQDIIHPGIQRSRFSLALKAPPCVPGYTFIIPSPPTYSYYMAQ